MAEKEIRMIDVVDPEAIEVIVSLDRKTAWVNVDGICRFRGAFKMKEGKIGLTLPALRQMQNRPVKDE